MKQLLLSFLLMLFGISLNAQILADGVYQLYSDVNGNAIGSPTSPITNPTDTSSNLMEVTADLTDNFQLYELIHQGSDVYKIRNLGTNKYIGLKDNWCGVNAEVIAAFEETDTNVEFLISSGTDGRYLITNSFGGDCVGADANTYYFDLTGSGVVRTFNDTGNNQQFRFRSTTAIVPSGVYQIFSDTNNEALASPTNVNQDDSMDSTINNLFSATPDFSDNYQLFEFFHQGNGVYKIKNLGTDLYVGLKDNFCGNFGEVIARFNQSDSGTDILVTIDSTTGRYLFQKDDASTCSYFDLSGGGSGAKIRTFNDTGNNQQFRIVSHVWNGGTDTSWTDASNWSSSPNSVPGVYSKVRIANETTQPTIGSSVTVDELAISSGATLTLNNDLTVEDYLANDGTFTANSGSSLIVNGTSSGNITYNRVLTNLDWHLLSSPVVGQSVDDFVASISNLATGGGSNIGLGNFIEATNKYGFYNGTLGAGVNFTNGKGHAVLLTAAETVSYTGTLSTDNVTFSVELSGPGRNLVGNPYPSYLAVNDNAIVDNNLLDVNAGLLLEQTIWVHDTATNDYRALNLMTSAADDIFIAPAQGFFVRVNTTGDFTFMESMQSHTQSTFKSSASSTSHPQITLQVKEENRSYVTDVYFANGATLGWDNGFDSSTLNIEDNTSGVSTKIAELGTDKYLAIQTLPTESLEQTLVLDLDVKASVGSTIEFSGILKALATDYTITLEDAENNTFTDLSNGGVYTTVASENKTNRFYLHLNNKSLSTSTPIGEPVLRVYNVNQTRTVKVEGFNNSDVTINLVNVLGQMVYSKKLSSGTTTVELPTSLRSGIYIVNATSQEGKVTKKIVLE